MEVADKYLSPEEVCDLIPGMTVKKLAQARWKGEGPPYIKPSPKHVIYSLAAVTEFLESRQYSSTRDHASAEVA